MKTDCELEVEQDKRENSRTNTARFQLADLSLLLKGEIKRDRSVFVSVGGRDSECVWTWMSSRHGWWCCLYHRLPDWDPGFSEFVCVFTSVCGVCGRWNHSFYKIIRSSVSKPFRLLIFSLPRSFSSLLAIHFAGIPALRLHTCICSPFSFISTFQTSQILIYLYIKFTVALCFLQAF